MVGLYQFLYSEYGSFIRMILCAVALCAYRQTVVHNIIMYVCYWADREKCTIENISQAYFNMQLLVYYIIYSCTSLFPVIPLKIFTNMGYAYTHIYINIEMQLGKMCFCHALVYFYYKSIFETGVHSVRCACLYGENWKEILNLTEFQHANVREIRETKW